MFNKTKIVIAGIGGVGGYFGGLLARCYAGNDEIAVYFIARGEHLTQIKNEGLKVIKGEIEFIAKPQLATDDPSEIGIADYIVVCTKNYDLDLLLNQIAPCVGKNTVILPLLNGIIAVEKIRAKFPDNIVPLGCTYIVSAIVKPGLVENLGNKQEIYFGLTNSENTELEKLESLLKFAGIEATLSDQINRLVWEKFIFLSSLATATTYYNATVGKLLEGHLEEVKKLLQEVTAIAFANQVNVDQNIIDKALNNFKAMPYETTSSMHRDFQSKKEKTELDSITGYVINKGQELGIKIPTFENAYLALKK